MNLFLCHTWWQNYSFHEVLFTGFLKLLFILANFCFVDKDIKWYLQQGKKMNINLKEKNSDNMGNFLLFLVFEFGGYSHKSDGFPMRS